LKKVADEAQLIAQYEIIKSIVPDAEVTLLTYPRSVVQEHYPQLKVIPTPRLHQSLPAILRADLFVLAGGPFYDDTFQTIRAGLLTLFTRLVGVPIMIYGVTGFPIRSRLGRWIYRWIGNQAQRIVTRDAGASHALQEVGVKTPIQQGIDLRAVLKVSPRERVNEILKAEGIDPSKPLIGFTVRHIHEDIPAWVKQQVEFNADTIRDFNRALGQTAAELSKSAQVFILAMNPTLDEDLAVMENMKQFMDDPSQLKIIDILRQTCWGPSMPVTS
jgi:polysaccharide pyruvyl transferase WcaK-like protein